MLHNHSTEMALRRERQQQRVPPTLQEQIDIYKLVSDRRRFLGLRPLGFRPLGRSKYTGEALRAIRARKVNFLGEGQR